MTSIIALANQKGGVGKTTTAVNLAWYLAAEGWRTLLLDLDPQGNATSSLGLHKYPDQPTSLDWMLHHAALDDCLQSTGRERLSIMGANRDLAAAELDLKTLQRPQRRLAELLAPAQHRWDVVIIDCPPSLGLLTVNGLTAAQHVIIPVQCEYLALEGLAEVTGTIERIGRSLNPSLAVLGLVMTMFDSRTRLSIDVVRDVHQRYPELMFRALIPRSVRVAEAPSHGRSIFEYDPGSRGAEAYGLFGTEVIARLRLEHSSQDGEGSTSVAADAPSAESLTAATCVNVEVSRQGGGERGDDSW